jgi:anti-anti-sigma factor
MRAESFGCVLVHETGRGAVAWLSGDLDRSAAPVLLHQLLEILDLPHDRLTLDLAQVGYLDVNGVTAMNVARKRAESRNIELVIDGLRADIRRALQPTELAGSLRPAV